MPLPPERGIRIQTYRNDGTYLAYRAYYQRYYSAYYRSELGDQR